MEKLKVWIQAARLRTLPLAAAGWLVGTSLAMMTTRVNWLISCLTLVTAFLLQILSNLANDFGDAVSGVDFEERDGPERMVQSGQITRRSMRQAIIIVAILSLISGCFLLSMSFRENFLSALIFLIIGLIGIGAAINYTIGKNPYGYAGFGDLFVFIFFGLVLVFGTFYLQVQQLNWHVFLPAISVGLLSIGVLNVNNIRDIDSDRLSGKNSIPVRIGRDSAVIYHVILLMGSLLSTVAFTILNYRSGWQFLFMLVSLLLFKNIKAVSSKPLSELDPYLKQMAISTLLFAVLFSIGLIVGRIF